MDTKVTRCSFCCKGTVYGMAQSVHKQTVVSKNMNPNFDLSCRTPVTSSAS
jgi:hypothetical protein